MRAFEPAAPALASPAHRCRSTPSRACRHSRSCAGDIPASRRALSRAPLWPEGFAGRTRFGTPGSALWPRAARGDRSGLHPGASWAFRNAGRQARRRRRSAPRSRQRPPSQALRCAALCRQKLRRSPACRRAREQRSASELRRLGLNVSAFRAPVRVESGPGTAGAAFAFLGPSTNALGLGAAQGPSSARAPSSSGRPLFGAAQC